jgi:selenocysteine lyase/cysteine desulfurase
VALPHVSNLLGQVCDLGAVCRAAHHVGARVVADGVAYAPHRAVDVAAWEVDFYAFSLYKVYGPHLAVLYGKREILDELSGPNHFFVGREEEAYFFEPGGPSHEACAGLLGVGDYLKYLVGAGDEAACDRRVVDAAFTIMEAWEKPLLERLLGYLQEHPRVRLLGSAIANSDRVGTVSFVHAERSAAEITAAVDRTEVAIRHGHMYAYHLCEVLGLRPADGVVRVSFVHYNTLAEIERLIEILDPVL